MTNAPKAAPDITALLGAARRGESQALDDLFPLVYEELRELARGQRRRWHGDFTMNATALVHEAYVKLSEGEEIPSESRGHFFAVAARVMRHILCNYARDRGRLKRGGGAAPVTIDEEWSPGGASDPSLDELIMLDLALRGLEEVSERQSRVVECRFFLGLNTDETADALDLSPATVKRDWAMAKAWLFRELRTLD